MGAGGEETRRVIEAAHERVIERVLEWIEDDVAVIRYGKDGIYRVAAGLEGIAHRRGSPRSHRRAAAPSPGRLDRSGRPGPRHMNRYADHEDADALRSAREDDQRTHHPQQPDPHQGREAGPGR